MHMEMCEGLGKMTELYKNLQSSDVVRDGKRVRDYKRLLKHLKIKEIISRIVKRNDNYDRFFTEDVWVIDSCLEDYYPNKRIAVYTALFGRYDCLPEPIIDPVNVDYYVITDLEIPNNSRWKKIDPMSYMDGNLKMSNVEKNRYFKMMPHICFSSYDYSIYVDANVLITSDISPLIKTLDCFPIAMFLHKNRDCVYEEARACIDKGKGLKEELEKHIKLLKEHGVPRHFGLLEATVIVRKHHDNLCKHLMEYWWNEFQNASKRDQLSLVDTLWMNKISVKQVGVLGNNLFKCNKFIVLPHN